MNANVQEVWKCLLNDYGGQFGSDFVYKIKTRVNSNGNGLKLRGYCETSFVGNQCNPSYSSTANRFVVDDCSSSLDASNYELTHLW